MSTSTVTVPAASPQALLSFPLRSRPSAAPEASVRPTPCLKWAGGKRQLLPEIFARFPSSFGTYWEPFLGGGAVFFGLAPKRAVLSDLNAELINVYCALRDDVHAVIHHLQHHVADEDYYYYVRSLQRHRLSPAAAAARTIYLNRTSFNGLYRVNSRNEFNVPFGRHSNPTICNVSNLQAVSHALRSADLRARCVFDLKEDIEAGDLVYLDPPYYADSRTASFVSYTSTGFDRDDQVRLAELFARLAEKGVHVVLSNADDPFIRDIYRDFRIDRVTARRSINSRADRRGNVAEVIVSTN